MTQRLRDLSARFESAQAYFHSEQNDGEAWLLAANGAVTKRWIGEYPELALGEPAGVERRLLDAYGIVGKPRPAAVRTAGPDGGATALNH